MVVRTRSIARASATAPVAMMRTTLVVCVITVLAWMTAGPAAASIDGDGDGLTADQEAELGTDPDDPDTDGDAMPDGWEVAHGLDPLVAGRGSDTDGDQLADSAEFVNATDPVRPDTDDDGMDDGWEIRHGFDPLIDDGRSDRDGGGLRNRDEFAAGTDPSDPTDDAAADADQTALTPGLDEDDAEDAAAPADATSGYTIEGSVVVDDDRDGAADPAEIDMSGVRVELLADGRVIATTTTASPYRFTNVDDGRYEVRIDTRTLPAGRHPTSGVVRSIEVAGADTTGVDFGANFAQISGSLVDPLGRPIANAPIEVVDEAGTRFVTTSDHRGRYVVQGSEDRILVLGAAIVRVDIGGEPTTTSVELDGASVRVDIAVDPASATAGAPTDTALPPALALTGSDDAALAGIGMATLVLGGALVMLSRRSEANRRARTLPLRVRRPRPGRP